MVDRKALRAVIERYAIARSQLATPAHAAPIEAANEYIEAAHDVDKMLDTVEAAFVKVSETFREITRLVDAATSGE